MIVLLNTTDEEIIVMDHLFRENGEDNDSYEIPNTLVPLWADDSEVISKIADGSLQLSLNEVPKTDISQAIDIIKGLIPKQVENIQQPFAAKRLPNGKKLYRRIHGITTNVDDIEVTLDFTVPYTACKILGLQILNGKLGDKANFKVLDTVDGLVQQSMGVPAQYITPHLQLNQFGFDVYIEPGIAKYPSKYDADLIAGMVLRIEYDAIDELLPRTVYINYDLHEVKD